MGRRSVTPTSRALVVLIVGLCSIGLLSTGPAAASKVPRPPEGVFNVFLDAAIDYLGSRDGSIWIDWPKAGGAIAHFGIVDPTPEDLRWLRQRAPRHTTIKVKAVQFSNRQLNQWANQIARRFNSRMITEISFPRANRVFIGLERWDRDLVRELRATFPTEALGIRKVSSDWVIAEYTDPHPPTWNPQTPYLLGWEVLSIN